jgi:dethiobiotin synthase|tara:strand:+ start:156 stop:794 length:639 start_codon:yes stop_codon:yes gene_type:complete
VPRTYFISGTDTNVGKTIVSAVLATKLEAHYFKPIQCGLNKMNLKDSEVVKSLSNKAKILNELYFLKKPLSPFVAAKQEKKKIDVNKILQFVKNLKTKKLVIEGAGGLNVPINSNYLMSDLCQKLNTPLILVSRTKLGTINHTLMSLEVIKKKKIKLLGIIFFGKKELETLETIKFFGKKILKKNIKILGRLPIAKELSKNTIQAFTKKIEI